jgi:hypothetical protein
MNVFESRGSDADSLAIQPPIESAYRVSHSAAAISPTFPKTTCGTRAVWSAPPLANMSIQLEVSVPYNDLLSSLIIGTIWTGNTA